VATLKQVLAAKQQQASELKRKLGITPIQEMKQDIKQNIQTIKDSAAYQKTNEKLHEYGAQLAGTQAYQKTSAGLKTAGESTKSAIAGLASFTGRKLSEARNSQIFKSVEEKVGGAYSGVKGSVRGSQSEQTFEQALSQAANGDAASAPGTPGYEKIPEI